MKSGFVAQDHEKQYKLVKEFVTLEHQPDFVTFIDVETMHHVAHWSIWFVAYYYTHSLYHFMNSAILALKSDIVKFMAVNTGAVCLQF